MPTCEPVECTNENYYGEPTSVSSYGRKKRALATVQRQDKTLEEFIGLNNMPNPVAKQKNVAKELQCELDFIPEVQAEIAEKNESTLNEEQAALIKTLKDAIKKGEGGVFAVEAHGGTGKTYCINTLLAMLRAQKEIATAMAISGTQAS